MLWWLATRYFWMQTTIMLHKDSTIWCPCKDGNLKIKYNNHHDHMMHRPVVLHLNQLRRRINTVFISERFCNPLLHFKMTKDDEMPKVEEMAAVTLTNILWETCTNILGLHWQIHHGSVWQPDQYDQLIKQGGMGRRYKNQSCAWGWINVYYNAKIHITEKYMFNWNIQNMNLPTRFL